MPMYTMLRAEGCIDALHIFFVFMRGRDFFEMQLLQTQFLESAAKARVAHVSCQVFQSVNTSFAGVPFPSPHPMHGFFMTGSGSGSGSGSSEASTCSTFVLPVVEFISDGGIAITMLLSSSSHGFAIHLSMASSKRLSS